METCYKVFRKEVLEQITIEEGRFGFEPVITAKIANYDRESVSSKFVFPTTAGLTKKERK